MESVKEIIIKRINSIDEDVLNKVTDTLKMYGVNLLNDNNEFILEDFRNDYFKTYDFLFRKDIPINGIRYQLYDFVSAVQVIVGVRNFYRFLSE